MATPILQNAPADQISSFRQLIDPRAFQIAALGSFLIYGISNLGWNDQALRVAVIITTALVVQSLAILALKLPWNALKSGAITGLGLSLLFYSSTPWLWVLAPALAIGSKYIIQYKGKHIFNPANFGIIIPILLTGDAWVSPGQWGNSTMLIFFFAVSALMILARVGRVDTSLSFFLTLLGLEFLRSVLYLGWDVEWLMHKMTNGSILLFTFFMITDPRTTPNHRYARLAWASGIAVIAFVLTSYFQLHTAPIWALFFASPITAFLDHFFRSRGFKW